MTKGHLLKKVMTFLTFLLGVGLFTWLALQQDGAKLWEAMSSVGWSIVIVIASHVFLPMVITAHAWRVLEGRAFSFELFYRARWIREAGKNLLPLMQLGGDAAGARVLMLGGVSTNRATIITIADLTTEAAALIPFAIFGIVFALSIAADLPDPDLLQGAIVGCILLVVAAILFLLLQRFGLFRVVERFIFRTFGASVSLHESLMSLYGQLSKSGWSCFWHGVAWLAGSFEIWLIFYLIGAPISPQEALLFESLGQAIKTAAFFIPAAIGVQEGSFILIGAAIGVAPEHALAASLLRRVRHLVVGIPALIYWSRIESFKK